MLSALISSELSYPAMQLALQPVHQRFVHSGPLVLGAAPVKLPTPTADRDQTVSRRFKPSSRTTLNGEQPYPWDRLQPQYLLSVERWPFHTEPPDHYVLLSHLLDLSVSQLSYLLPLHYQSDFRPDLGNLRTPPLLFGRRPPQSNCLPCTVPDPDYGSGLEPQRHQGGISRTAPQRLASLLQSLPPILHK